MPKFLLLTLGTMACALLVAQAGCVTPRSRPLASFAPMGVAGADSASETRAECRRMRDRSLLSGAGAGAAAALASGLGAVAIPVDREGVEIGLGVASAVTAAVAAGLALLSTSYGGALDTHCSPWPNEGRP